MKIYIKNRSVNPMGHMGPYLESFLPFAQKKMGFNRPPTIFFDSDQKNAENVLGKTGYYDPESDQIVVYVDKRHPKDILRSLSHELVHHAQNCRGDLNPDIAGETGLGYAQTNPHMRGMESEAFKNGNLCFRDWEDSVKIQLQMKIQLQETNYKHTTGEIHKMTTYEQLKEDITKKVVAMLTEKFKGRQSKLDANKDGKISAEDFEMLRKDEQQESVAENIPGGPLYKGPMKKKKVDYPGRGSSPSGFPHGLRDDDPAEPTEVEDYAMVAMKAVHDLASAAGVELKTDVSGPGDDESGEEEIEERKRRASERNKSGRREDAKLKSLEEARPHETAAQRRKRQTKYARGGMSQSERESQVHGGDDPMGRDPWSYDPVSGPWASDPGSTEEPEEEELSELFGFGGKKKQEPPVSTDEPEELTTDEPEELSTSTTVTTGQQAAEYRAQAAEDDDPGISGVERSMMKQILAVLKNVGKKVKLNQHKGIFVNFIGKLSKLAKGALNELSVRGLEDPLGRAEELETLLTDEGVDKNEARRIVDDLLNAATGYTTYAGLGDPDAPLPDELIQRVVEDGEVSEEEVSMIAAHVLGMAGGSAEAEEGAPPAPEEPENLDEWYQGELYEKLIMRWTK